MLYENKKSNFGTVLIIIILVMIIGMLIFLMTKIEKNYENIFKNEETKETGIEAVKNEFSIENLVKNSMYSICGISKLNNPGSSAFIENSNSDLGVGSGVILTSDGYILTSAKIVGEVGESSFVTLRNGRNYVAEVVWNDKQMDIAIIKIAESNLITLKMGDSDKVDLGQNVYLLSNPFGYNFNQDVQETKICEKDKTYKIVNEDLSEFYIEDVLKINFNIKNSQTGGALLNESGEVIGIASSKINSVIPINRIKNIINKFEEKEDFKEVYLGIDGFDSSTLKYFNVPESIKKGIYIEKIEENSPVNGKMQSGDVLVSIDGKELNKMQDLREILYSKNPGDKVTLKFIRDSKKQEIEIILNEKK